MYDPAKDPLIRSKGVGGSELAPMFNVSKYGDVHTLWRLKRGLGSEEGPKKIFERGHKLEPIISAEFAHERGVDIWNPHRTFYGDLPWMFAHPDRLFTGKDGQMWGLEIKTASREVFLRNRQKGLDFGYLLQSIYYLYITGATGWVLRMKHPDSWEDRDFIIRKDDDTLAIWNQIRERGNWFWNLVETATPPPIETKPEKIPQTKQGEITFTDEAAFAEAASYLYEAEQIADEAQYTLQLAKQAVRELMESRQWELVEGPTMTPIGIQNLRVYWREQKGRKTYKGKEAVAVLNRIKKLAEEGDFEAVAELMRGYDPSMFIKIGDPSKSFRRYWVRNTTMIEGDTNE